MSQFVESTTERHGYRWVILILAWLAFTMTAVDRSTWGPASVSVADHLGVSLGALGVFATGYYIGYVISNAAGGLLTDWLGPRIMMGSSLFLAGGFMLLFGQAESAAVGIAFQAGIGIFAGCDYSAGVKAITQWFPASDRGFAMGVFMTATSLGVVIANAVVPRLIEASGWQASYRFFGMASMVVAVLCLVFIREATNTTSTRRQVPDLRQLSSNRDLWLLGLGGFCALWGTYGFITWSNALMIKGSDISPVKAGGVVVIFGIAAIAAKPVVGVLSDILGMQRKTLATIMLIAFSASLILFGLQDGLTGFYWVAPLLGVFAYAYSPLLVALIPQLAGARLAGSAAGATNAFWQLGSAAVPVVLGMVFAQTQSFFWAFATLAVGPLLGAVLISRVRETAPNPGTALTASTATAGRN